MTDELPPLKLKPLRAVLGVLVLLYVPLWLHLAESDALRGVPRWIGLLSVAGLLTSIFAGVFLVVNGLGLLNSEVLALDSTDRAPTLRTFVTVYLGSMLLVAVGAFVASAAFDWHPLPVAVAESGVFFLLASRQRPWWLFASMRRVGWFASIRKDATVRWLLRGIGFVMAVWGLVAALLRVPFT